MNSFIVFSAEFQELERVSFEKEYVGYLNEYKRQANTISTEKFASYRNPASKLNVIIRKIKNTKQYAGLIYFKKGDMDEMCREQVDRASKMGLDGVVLYYPVHYSGGNSMSYKMPTEPKYGVHYKFEIDNRPTNEELFNCLDHISTSGLKLNFAPHLESVRTLVAPEKGEWRLLSGIPLDDKYLRTSFDSFFYYLSKSQNFKKEGDVKITVFSEIDPMVLSYPSRSLKLIKNIKKESTKILKYTPEIVYNTNGDFYNGWKLPQSKQVVSCFYLDKLLKEIDTIAPSIYGDRGHVGFDSSAYATADSTIEKYFNRINIKLNELCNNDRYDFDLTEKNLSFGEFALDPTDSKQSYKNFFKNTKRSISFINYWNHGIWDHLGIYNGTPSNQRFFKELTKEN